MFWGLDLKPNRKYSQTTLKSFHISQAALDIEGCTNSTPNKLYMICDGQKFLICTLRKDTCEQVMLDLNIAEGEEVGFQCVGNGHVTLSGYVIDEDDPFMDNNEEEEEIEDSENEKIEQDLRNTLNKKAKKGEKEKILKNALKVKEDDEDSDSLNGTNEFGESDENDSDDDDEEDEEGDEEEEDDDSEDDEEEDDEDEEVQQPKAKQPKLEKAQKQQNGVAKLNADKKDNKKENAQHKAGGERTLSGGVKVEDIRIGNGPEVKAGKRAQVYYEGRLKSNNKVFDSLKAGSGFKFNVGRNEVIKGWDIGVVGMKVGGKRKIVCPPHMAYGARGSPPTIPPNSTLIFDVELKGVN